MNAPVKIGTVTMHHDLVQGSDEWLQARCGLLTASEFSRIVRIAGGGKTVEYRATGKLPGKLTPKRVQALGRIGERQGSMRELAFLAEVSDGVLRELLKAGALEAVETTIPVSIKAADDEKERMHLWELAAQRITQFVEPQYISDAMLRGHEDEEFAREHYSKTWAPVQQVGFVTNDKWGFTLGCSPDGLVGDDGLIEAKSRCQRFQVQTVCDWHETRQIPDEFKLQVQGELLVTGRKWCDLISYSGGLPMLVMRIEPDPEVQDAILDAACKFEARINEVVAVWAEALACEDSRFCETFRRIEQEMYL